MAAATALGEIGGPAAVRSLIEASTDTSEAVRLAVLSALGKTGSAAAAVEAAASARTAPAGSGGSPAGGQTAEADSGPKATLLTGPVEHWFLSADVPVTDTDAEIASFNEQTQQFDDVPAPSRFMIGANFLLGDLVSSKRPFIQNFYAKGMVLASNRPLDAYGWAVGLRGSIPFLKEWGINFDLLSPWVGRTYTKFEEKNDAGETVRRGRKAEWGVGIGLNLDRALDWLK